MAVKTTTLTRSFIYNGTAIPDPSPTATPEKCLEILSLSYPDLTNASIEAPKLADGKMVYNLKTVVGTKG